MKVIAELLMLGSFVLGNLFSVRHDWGWAVVGYATMVYSFMILISENLREKGKP